MQKFYTIWGQKKQLFIFLLSLRLLRWTPQAESSLYQAKIVAKCNTRIFSLNESEPTNLKKDTTLRQTILFVHQIAYRKEKCCYQKWHRFLKLFPREHYSCRLRVAEKPTRPWHNLPSNPLPGLHRSWDANGSSSTYIFSPVLRVSAEEDFNCSLLSHFKLFVQWVLLFGFFMGFFVVCLFLVFSSPYPLIYFEIRSLVPLE